MEEYVLKAVYKFITLILFDYYTFFSLCFPIPTKVQTFHLIHMRSKRYLLGILITTMMILYLTAFTWSYVGYVPRSQRHHPYVSAGPV